MHFILHPVDCCLYLSKHDQQGVFFFSMCRPWPNERHVSVSSRCPFWYKVHLVPQFLGIKSAKQLFSCKDCDRMTAEAIVHGMR